MSQEALDDEPNTESRVHEEEPSDNPVETDRTTAEATEEDSGAVVNECTSMFSTSDFIMEPNVVQVLLRFFQFGGMPDEAVRLLSENYSSVAQTANLLCDCLVMSGVDVNQIQERVEGSLRQLLVKRFEPQCADAMFANEAEAPVWLNSMISHRPWRSLFFKLVEEYPECLLLNFAIRLISDAGHQEEIAGVASASQQIEVFLRVFKASLIAVLRADSPAALRHSFGELLRVSGRGEHTYLLSVALIQALRASLEDYLQGLGSHAPLSAPAARCAHCAVLLALASQLLTCISLRRGHDVTPLQLACSRELRPFPRECQALYSMLAKRALNTADINTLYTSYTSSTPPPVELIRLPLFLDMLIETLFVEESSFSATLNPESRSKCAQLVAIAATAQDAHQDSSASDTRAELEETRQALEKAREVCALSKSSVLDVLSNVSQIHSLFRALKIPVVATGVLRFLEHILFVEADEYFRRYQTDPQSFHFVLLDEVASAQPILHERVRRLLIQLFEFNLTDFDVNFQFELKRLLVDRFVHLLTRGYVLPVVRYFRNSLQGSARGARGKAHGGADAAADLDAQLMPSVGASGVCWIERQLEHLVSEQLAGSGGESAPAPARQQSTMAPSGPINEDAPVKMSEIASPGAPGSSVDVSLIRYFVFSVIDVVGPPFSDEFVAEFLPLANDPLLMAGLASRTGFSVGHSTVSPFARLNLPDEQRQLQAFIQQCQSKT